MPYSDQIIQDEKQYEKCLTVYQENCCNKSIIAGHCKVIDGSDSQPWKEVGKRLKINSITLME